MATLGLAGAGIQVLSTWCFVLQKSPLPRKVACPFEEVGHGQAGNLTLPSGMLLPLIAVHSPDGASSCGFASSTGRVAAVGWCFGYGLAWLVLGLRSVPSHG